MFGTVSKLECAKGVEGKKPPFASSETLFSPGQSSLAELQVWLSLESHNGSAQHFPSQNVISVQQFRNLGEEAKIFELMKVCLIEVETSLLYYWVQIVPLLGPFSSAFSSIETQLLEVQFLASSL